MFTSWLKISIINSEIRKGVMTMKTILLVCSAGMSTSLLVTKMEAAAKEQGVEAKIFALPF